MRCTIDCDHTVIVVTKSRLLLLRAWLREGVGNGGSFRLTSSRVVLDAHQNQNVKEIGSHSLPGFGGRNLMSDIR